MLQFKYADIVNRSAPPSLLAQVRVVLITSVITCITFLKMKNAFVIRKEGTVLFNDALNTFYLRLYGVGAFVISAEYRLSCHFDYYGI